MKSPSFLFHVALLTFIVLSAGISSASQAGDQRTPSLAKVECSEIEGEVMATNKQIVMDFFAKFSEGKINEAFHLVAPNVKWWVPESLPFGGVFDRTGYLTQVLPKFAGFQGGLKLTVKGLLAEGNMVAAEVESYGVHVCGSPQNFVYNNRYHFKITLRDGLFVEVNEYNDTFHLEALYQVTQAPECKAKLNKN